MHTNNSRGFTLIELLVVIAIIGILAAVIVAALGTARSKSQDASIQADLSTIQTQAEVYFANTGGYANQGLTRSTFGCPASGGTNMFSNDPTIFAAINAANNVSGGSANIASVNSNVYCSYNISGTNGGINYVVDAKLVNGVTVGSTVYYYWCVDSSGNAVPEASLLAGKGSCPIPPQ